MTTGSATAGIVVVRTKDAVRAAVREARCAGQRVGLVPTMGALHDGHLSLVVEASRRCDLVVVSVFVNPTQFGPEEDLEAYPRDLDGDLAALATLGDAGPDLVFAPSVEEMYPRPAITRVLVPPLGDTMDGERRPGHFDGVGLVVTKLLAVVRPDVAVFGRKDAQQLAIVRRLVADLDLGVGVVGAAIVREDDGLAMSSRNRYLGQVDSEDRAAARVLSRSLRAAVVEARAARERGERPDPGRIEQVVRVTLDAEPRARVDDVAVRDPDTLAPLDIRGEAAGPDTRTNDNSDDDGTGRTPAGTRLLVAIAVHVGPPDAPVARLIDNVVLGDTDAEQRLMAATEG